LPNISKNKQLPQLIEDITFDNSSPTAMLMNPDNLAMTIYSIFMILKLMSIGHPKSQPYYGEICGKIFPHKNLDDCEANLFSSLSKFDNAKLIKR
jgi:hypothetical protein